MEIRGHRECLDCGVRWSYYETGSVACPDCASVHSRGLDDERALHTATPVEFDLTEVRLAVDELSSRELARKAKDLCRSFVTRHGFVVGGELQPLDDTYVAALELLHVADSVDRTLTLDDRQEHHFLTLLATGDQGDRPAPAEVPPPLQESRGLAIADAITDYHGDVRQWLDRNPHPEVRPALSRLREHEKRLHALDGNVDPAAAERLLSATRDVGTYLREGDENALSSALERLDRLDGPG